MNHNPALQTCFNFIYFFAIFVHCSIRSRFRSIRDLRSIRFQSCSCPSHKFVSGAHLFLMICKNKPREAEPQRKSRYHYHHHLQRSDFNLRGETLLTLEHSSSQGSQLLHVALSRSRYWFQFDFLNLLPVNTVAASPQGTGSSPELRAKSFFTAPHRQLRFRMKFLGSNDNLNLTPKTTTKTDTSCDHLLVLHHQTKEILPLFFVRLC